MRAERVLVANGSASGGQHGEPVNPKHDPPLCWVARKNQAHLVDLLVEGENAGLEVRHDGGATPLYLAAQEGHIEVVRRLLRHGARVDAVDTDGWVPLHAAAQNGHLTCVELLLDAHKARNVPVDVYSTQNSLTPLHLAAREGNADIVRALLRAGPDPRARTKAGATSLHLAAGHGNLDSLLISSGADPSVVNSLNRTALRQAIANGHGDLVLLFLSPRGTPPRARTDS
ncbi:ankyrin repeat-containing domain protein, partial [Hyaloraphidium curvatum]